MATIDTKKAEILLHAVIHDRNMAVTMKKRILQMLMSSGVTKDEIEHYMTYEKWPEKTSYDPGYDPEREYKVRITPARRRAALRNLVVIGATLAMLTFAVMFWFIGDSDEPKIATESAPIEQPTKNIEEGSKL